MGKQLRKSLKMLSLPSDNFMKKKKECLLMKPEYIRLIHGSGL